MLRPGTGALRLNRSGLVVTIQWKETPALTPALSAKEKEQRGAASLRSRNGDYAERGRTAVPLPGLRAKPRRRNGYQSAGVRADQKMNCIETAQHPAGIRDNTGVEQRRGVAFSPAGGRYGRPCN